MKHQLPRIDVLLPLALLLAIASPLVGQNPGMRRNELQRQVMQRFMQNVRTQAGLGDEQFQEFSQVARRAFEGRARLSERERSLWMALDGQMRPGVAADADSVTSILATLVEVGDQRVELLRREQAEYAAFLSPIQRAQVTIAWRRLQMQIDRIRMGRMQDRRPM